MPDVTVRYWQKNATEGGLNSTAGKKVAVQQHNFVGAQLMLEHHSELNSFPEADKTLLSSPKLYKLKTPQTSTLRNSKL